MANSKSNIYPIQLQGAELCLNRYDAEIKQYRGFNKNNSPFVGGCLSNVFTKKEQITGGNADNTYIDTNGDVYRVDTNGLYKNDEVLINYNGFSGRRFLDCEEIKVKDNVVRVFNEKIQLERMWGEWTPREILMVGTKFVLRVNGTLLEDSPLLFFNVQESFTEDIINTYVQNSVTCIYITIGTKLFAVVAGLCFYKNALGYKSLGVQLIIIDMDTFEVVTNRMDPLYETNSVTLNGDIPIAIMYTRDSNNNNLLSVYYTYNDTRAYVCTINDNGEFINYINKRQETFSVTLSSNRKLVSNNIKDYIPVSYPTNSLYLKNLPQTTLTDSSYFFIVRTVTNPVYDNDTFKFNNYFISSTQSKNFYSKNNYDLKQEYNLKQGEFTSLYTAFDYQVAITGGDDTTVMTYCVNQSSGNSSFFQMFDYKGTTTTPQASTDFTFSKGKFVGGAVLEFGYGSRSSYKYNFRLLLNNNRLSGIAGKYVLLTNWNTVEPYSIIYYQDLRRGASLGGGFQKIYYRENGKWFVIKPGTPKLKLKGEQLVVNIDAYQNSYSLRLKKILFFAPNFNGALSGVSYVSYLFNNSDNTVLIATAHNEYKQEENNSIILNPITVSVSGSVYSGTPGVDYPIDVYENENGNNIVKYKKTLNVEGEYDRELEGLTFPIDTNGNVQYSPSLFADIKNAYGNKLFIKNGVSFYPAIIGNNTLPIMSFYLASGIDNFEEGFIVQGQFYGIINNFIYNVIYTNGVVSGLDFVVSVENLKFVGNTPYEALFFSKTNRCLYSFTGANVLNQKQLVDKISEVRNYLYNPATQTVFLITDIGVLFYGLFGMFLLEYTDISNIFLLDNGIVMSDNSGNYRYIKYYLDEGDTDYTKENINVETSFYGMNNEVVTINDCLYFRIFSEEHEEGNLKVSATTISLSGRKTEETTFKIKASDWDKITHTIYLRYQPKTQRGLGVAFAIDSPFKIASLSVGSQPDAVLVDKVSKGAITAPSVTTNNNEW